MQNELSGITATVEAEILRIQTLKPDEVRALWCGTFKRDVPKLHITDLGSRAALGSDIDESRSSNASGHEPAVVSVPWEPAKFIAVKGVILDPPETAPTLKPESREAILMAIAKARQWIDDLTQDKASIAGIAKREGKIERHIRLLLPLAFVPPAVVRTIASGSAPTHLTVTGLAKRVPLSWNQQ